MCVPVPVRIVEDWVDELSTTPSPSQGWQAAVVHFVVFSELLCCSLLRKYLAQAREHARVSTVSRNKDT